MGRVAAWVLGWTQFKVTGAEPEEFFNRCAQKDLGFWDARQLDRHTWTLRTSFWRGKMVRPIAERAGCEVTVLRRGGAPGILYALRRRYALLGGMALSLCAVGILSNFVFTVRVEGNKRVPTGAILNELRANGVRPGAYGPGLDVRQVCHRVILELPELSWMAVNLHGTVAEVVVREGDPQPELVEEDVAARVVARYPGLITHMDVMKGMALVSEGDTVAAGDVLIDSWVDFVEPEGYKGDMGGMEVRAAGRVEARVWRTLRAALPLERTEKRPTGRSKTLRWAEILGRRVNFFRKGGIPYEKYDKIIRYSSPLPGLVLASAQCAEYEEVLCPADRREGEEALKTALLERLDALTGEGEVISAAFTLSEERGLLVLTLQAECLQEIGQVKETR